MRFLNGTALYSTRMYTTLGQIRNGWTRIFTYLFEKNASAILHKIALYLIFSLSPFILLGFELYRLGLRSESFSAPLLASSAIVCAFIIAVRTAGNRLLKTQARYAILHPLGSLVMVWILLECLTRIALGRRSVWRGDQLPP
jgi:hypothetical protein